MPTTFCTPLDNVSTTLGADYAPSDTQITVADGKGALFGSPSPTAPVRVTIYSVDALDEYGRVDDRTLVASYKATGRTGDVLTGVTLDGGVDQDFVVGDKIAVVSTAETFNDLQDAINALENGGGGGSGTVTSVDISVPTGFSVSGNPITGAGTIQITTNLSGMLKGSGGAIVAASAGTDFLSPNGSGANLTALNGSNIASGTVPIARLPAMVGSGASHSAGLVPDPGASSGTTKYLREDGSWQEPPGGGGGGSLSSVGLTMPTGFSVSGSPLTEDGTIAVTTSLSGMLKGSGGAIVAATSGTDYALPNANTSGSAGSLSTTFTSGKLLGGQGTGVPSEVTVGTGLSLNTGTLTATNAGTVTSVAITVPTGLSVSGSPITSNGTFAITTSLSGIIKGSAGALVAATAGTDYLTPSGSGASLTSLNGSAISSGTVPTARLPAMVASGASHAAGIVPDPGASSGSTKFLREDATWAIPAGGGGGLASVGLAMPTGFSVSGSPLTSDGTITVSFSNATANYALIGPTSGSAAAPTFRALVGADVPATGLTISEHKYTPSSPSDGATITFDLSAADVFIPAALGGNRTLALSNSPSTAPWKKFTIILTQDATGSRTVTWFGGITWANNNAVPTLTTTANKRDVFSFLQIGNGSYLGLTTGQNF